MEHLIMYKLSQDVIEIFFGLLRSKLGYNKNPTAYQLEITYKNVLSIKKISTLNNGNCHLDDAETTILMAKLKEKPINIPFVEPVKKRTIISAEEALINQTETRNRYLLNEISKCSIK